MYSHDAPTVAPGLDAGVTLLRRPSGDSRALYRLVASHLDGGHALWVDARNRARTDRLRTADRGSLDGLRVARAFTAFQHHTLVDRAVDRVSGDTDLVVAPCTAALYRDDDVRDRVSEGLLADALGSLADAAATHDVPVLLTAAGDSPLEARVADAADRTLQARHTDEGLRFEGETIVYWGRDGFQTTIDYWVDLFGCVCESTHAPAEPAVVEG